MDNMTDLGNKKWSNSNSAADIAVQFGLGGEVSAEARVAFSLPVSRWDQVSSNVFSSAKKFFEFVGFIALTIITFSGYAVAKAKTAAKEVALYTKKFVSDSKEGAVKLLAKMKTAHTAKVELEKKQEQERVAQAVLAEAEALVKETEAEQQRVLEAEVVVKAAAAKALADAEAAKVTIEPVVVKPVVLTPATAVVSEDVEAVEVTVPAETKLANIDTGCIPLIPLALLAKADQKRKLLLEIESRRDAVDARLAKAEAKRQEAKSLAKAAEAEKVAAQAKVKEAEAVEVAAIDVADVTDLNDVQEVPSKGKGQNWLLTGVKCAFIIGAGYAAKLAGNKVGSMIQEPSFGDSNTCDDSSVVPLLTEGFKKMSDIPSVYGDDVFQWYLGRERAASDYLFGSADQEADSYNATGIFSARKVEDQFQSPADNLQQSMLYTSNRVEDQFQSPADNLQQSMLYTSNRVEDQFACKVPKIDISPVQVEICSLYADPLTCQGPVGNDLGKAWNDAVSLVREGKYNRVITVDSVNKALEAAVMNEFEMSPADNLQQSIGSAANEEAQKAQLVKGSATSPENTHYYKFAADTRAARMAKREAQKAQLVKSYSKVKDLGVCYAEAGTEAKKK